MPEVQRVADPPDEPDRPEGEERRGPSTRSEEHPDRAEGWRQGSNSGIGNAAVQEPCRRDDRGDAGSADCGPEASRETRQRNGPDREEATRGKLPGPRREGVERPPDRDVRDEHAQGERDNADDRERHADRRPSVASAGDEDGREEQRRPDEIELLLHGQRPEVEERRGRGDGREIVGRRRREPEVPDRERRRGPIEEQVRPIERVGENGGGRQRHDEDHDPGRGKAANASSVEVPKAHGPASLDLSKQQARDQEAGDHEEDVDADEAAADREESGVEQDHETHGDTSQALDVRAKPVLRRRRRRPLGRPAAARCHPASVVDGPGQAGLGRQPAGTRIRVRLDRSRPLRRWAAGVSAGSSAATPRAPRSAGARRRSGPRR